MITKKALAYSFLYFITFQAFTQETKGNNEKESRKGMQQLSLVVSHSHITEGESTNGGKEWIVVPAWGLDYNYWLSNHWAIGLHDAVIYISLLYKLNAVEHQMLIIYM